MSFNTTLVKRSVAAGLAIGAASVPAAAQAMPLLAAPAPPTAPAPQHQAPPGAPAPQHQAPVPGQPTSSDTSFRWEDAGIGAAGAVVLLGAGGLAAGALRRRRPQRALAD
jgi:hypothetical protein